MKHRLVSLAIAGVMLLSIGGAVSAGPTNENAVEASCHGQTVANLASNGIAPGHADKNPGDWNKGLMEKCGKYAPGQQR